MRFESPWLFLLLLAIPAVLWLSRRGHGSGAIGFPSVAPVVAAGSSIRVRLAVLLPVLRALALCMLVAALARPQKGHEQVRDISKGIAIEMVLDRSGSMGEGIEFRGEAMSKLDAVKQVFAEFVLGDGKDLDGRPNDLVGMVAFARYPDTICPLTLAHQALPEFLETVKVVNIRSEDGTAIGDGLAVAAARLKNVEETIARQSPDKGAKYEIKSRIIILLTDGQNNAGNRSPVQAAELAAKWGIKIYAIGIGSADGMVQMQTPFGTYSIPGMDEGTLESVAKATGGFYRRAADGEALRKVYTEIDKLEKSEVTSLRFVDYKEQFVPFAVAALVFLLLEVLLGATVLRRIP